MKSLIRSLAVTAFCLAGVALRAQMREVYVDNLQTNNNIYQISFLSPTDGFVAFANWVGYTTDSGRTFSKKYITLSNVNFNGYNVNLTFGFGIGGVKALSRDTVLVYGNYGFVPSILYSVDGGNSYTLIYQSQLNSQQLTRGVMNMVFPENSDIGYAVEADRIIKTTNRGKTWFAVLNSPNGFFNFAEGVDDRTVFAFSDNKLLKTTDGGSSWQQLSLPGLTLNYASFISAARGWINMQDNGGVYYTKDGGSTWQLKTIPDLTSIYTNKMHFVNDSTGYATGGLYTINKTTDSGKTWQPLPRDNTYSYLGYTHTDLFFLSVSQFWAGGGQGFLELTTNGGGQPLPRAYFKIDTTGEWFAHTVKLVNYSKTGFQYKWFRNDTLFSTTYDATYTRDIYRARDSIMLIVTDGQYSDTLSAYQNFTAAVRTTPPVIGSFSPVAAGAGGILTLKGIHFTGTTAVTVGGQAASSFSVVSDSVMTVMVGSGASGDITVTNGFGTASLAGFVYTTQLSILSFSPAAAQVGATLTITGTNFDPIASNDIVYVGGILTPVITSSSGSLTVKVPAGVSIMPVTVTTGGLTASSGQPFQYASPDPDSLSVNAFPSEINVNVPVNMGGMVVADFDGDGKADIATNDRDPNTGALLTLFNTSTPDSISYRVQPAGTSSGAIGGINSLQVGDIDGDGKPDAVVLDGAGFGIYKNISTPGNMSFAPMVDVSWGYATAGDQFAMADLDGDGKPDLVSATTFTNKVYRNISANGVFSFQNLPDYTIPSYLGSYIHGICTLMEVDGDGKPDAVVVTVNGIYVFLNTSLPGTISFARGVYFPVTTGLPTPGPFTSGDLDGDGKAEFIMGAQGSTVAILRNLSTPGNANFATSTTLAVSTPYSTYQMKTGDINGDGKAELVIAAYMPGLNQADDPQVFLWENKSVTGNIAFGPQITLAYDNIGHYDYSVSLADFNGDGKLDIGVAALQKIPALAIILNQSTTSVKLCAGSNLTLNPARTGASYEWRLKANGNFVPVSNDAHYSDVNSAALLLHDVPPSWTGNLYECWVDGKADKVFKLVVDTAVVPSVAIVSADSVVCTGQAAHFRAQSINGGTAPVYQWQINGVNMPGSDSLFSPGNLQDKDSITVRLTSNAACVSPDDTVSVAKYVTVKPNVPVSVYITATDTTICTGTPVIFAARAVNQGSHPSYNWLKNGVSTGSRDSIYLNNSVANGDVITVVLRSGEDCAIPATDTSQPISMVVHQAVIPSVAIVYGDSVVCAGQAGNFRAQSTNGGDVPVYQWQVNGVDMPGSGSVFAPGNLKDKDSVTVRLTSNAVCASTNEAVSAAKYVKVKPIVPVSVFVVPTATTICDGATVAFAARGVNQGSQPTYNWRKNGISTGPNDSLYLDNSIANGDLITVVLTSSETCAVPASDTSQPISMVVNPSAVPDVVIAGITNITAGQSSTAKTTIKNGGLHPSFQWQDSTRVSNWRDIVNAKDSLLVYVPANTGDRVRCILKSDGSCVARNTDTSNVLTFALTHNLVIPGDSSGVRYFPNPVRNLLTLDGLKASDRYTSVEILNIQGDRTIRVSNIDGQTKVEIITQGLSKGLYVLKLNKKSGGGPHFSFLKID